MEDFMFEAGLEAAAIKISKILEHSFSNGGCGRCPAGEAGYCSPSKGLCHENLQKYLVDVVKKEWCE